MTPAPPAQARPLGLLMLDTTFDRPPGDIGHSRSFRFPVRRAVVRGARVARIVREHPDPALLDPFIAAGRELVAQGVIGIGTSCGFLGPYQRELAGALGVPVAVSSLLQVPWVQACLPAGHRVGVITADERALGEAHLRAAGAPADTPRVGLPGAGAFAQAILHERTALDPMAVQAEVVAAGLELRRRSPEVGAIVLECTNLPVYRRALSEATGLPVFDVLTLLDWLWQGLAPAPSHFTEAAQDPADDETTS